MTDPRPVRILLLVTHMEPGGAQKAMFELAGGLRRRGHEVTCAVMYDKGSWIPEFERRYGLPVVDLEMKVPGRRLASVAALGAGLLRLRRLLRERRIEVIQTFSHFSNILGIWLAAVARVPVRVSSQRMTLSFAPRWLLLLDRLTVNRGLAHRMVAVSEATMRFSVEVEGMRAERLLVIPNGIDVAAFPRLDRAEARRRTGLSERVGTAPLVLTVARLHPQKGHRHLLDAASEILRQLPDVRFVCAGNGPLEGELLRRTAELGLEDNVCWLGPRPDVPALMAAADLVVLPSLWEGMPNTLLEAMAAGRAVVATDVDGSREVVVDGETGVLVPVADPRALAAAILRLLRSREGLERMAEAGHRRALDSFDHAVTVDRFEALYRELLGARGRAA